jgi:hypothetical protein
MERLAEVVKAVSQVLLRAVLLGLLVGFGYGALRAVFDSPPRGLPAIPAEIRFQSGLRTGAGLGMALGAASAFRKLTEYACPARIAGGPLAGAFVGNGLGMVFVFGPALALGATAVGALIGAGVGAAGGEKTA